MKKHYLYPIQPLVNGLDKKVFEHYDERLKNPRKTPSFIGPLINGIDVGKARYSDIYPTYPHVDLAQNIVYRDISFDKFSCRFYEHEGHKKDCPLVIYLHGGSFRMGSLERLNNIMERLVQLIDGCGVFVDYTLAPEAAYPVALEQCYEAIRYFYHHNQEYAFDNKKIVVMGDSSGGNYTASCCLKDTINNFIDMQVLYYPLLDLANYHDNDFSYDFFGQNLDPVIIDRLNNLKNDNFDYYTVNGEDLHDELISPGLAKDCRVFPKTLLFVAEYDYLAPQSYRFAERLDEAGVDLDIYYVKAVAHGFLERLGFFDQSDISLQIVADKIINHYN